uniref:SAM domain-containing protein n=1 Tax=Anopheles melas TaxID=34690 RepID=A0A182TGJ9_9DIPT
MDKLQQNGTENEAITEYYDPVAILLSSVNYDTENLTDVLRQCGVKYNQLSGLVEEDLRLMGMSNSKAIEEILSELSTLSNQTRLYDSVLRNEFNPNEYAQTVFKNSSEHVEAIRCMIELVKLKTQTNFPQNVLLDDRFYASEFSLQAVDKIAAKLTDIQSVLNEQAECENASTSQSRTKKLGLTILLVSSAVLFAVLYRKARALI